MPRFNVWHRRSSQTVILLFTAMASKPALSAMTLQDALRQATRHSQALPAQNYSAEAARERAIAADTLPDPVLRLAVENVPVDGPVRFSLDAERMTMRSIGLSQTYTRAAKRDAKQERYRQEEQVANARWHAQLSNLQTETAKAWLSLHFQHQLLHWQEQRREQVARQSEAMETAYRSGRASQHEWWSVQSQLLQLDEQLLAQRTQVENAEMRLQRWIGVEQPLVLADTMPNISALPFDLQQLRLAVDDYPEIIAMNAQVQLSKAEADVAKADTQSDWSWSVMYGIRDSDFGDMLSVGVSIPLQWNQENRQQRDYAAKLSEANQRRAETEEKRRLLLLDVQQKWNAWQSALARQKQYQQQLLPLAESRAEATQTAFASNRASMAAVFEARRAVLDTHLNETSLAWQAALLWAELYFLFPESEMVTAPIQSHAE
ncbi:TolC family protein [Permianibacter aggregans]|uniref:Outer membrane protein TolC n=1 Tax=Permianibacter aggregans TaxID=1510150 RepID=A0A4R6UE24_9GAMM|nr:TolC family protein [Permianibacter aggregans]QGX38165.1 TolC family protein [Permianibacter aggregans]TDQ44988.1 outer membrane protein TolC [Permianibacter aggregans]